MRILLADDEPPILKLCRQMFEGSGFQVLQAMGKVQLRVPVLVMPGHYPDDVIEN